MLIRRVLVTFATLGVLGSAIWFGAPTPASSTSQVKTPELFVGFGAADITPDVGNNRPVYMAGFGQNRRATGVNDRLMARTVVLSDGDQKFALVSIDVVGFFFPNVKNIRKVLSEFAYVLVSSTHNHEGPDTLGLWGPNPATSGVDPAYMKHVEECIVASVRSAAKNLERARAKFGSVKVPELLHDSREPFIKHDDLVVIEFAGVGKAEKPIGILVQWNCHPETLDDKNTLISADYVGYTVDYLAKKHRAPVAYFTGTVGGLMTSLRVPIKSDDGRELQDGTFEKTERYGQLLGQAADRALSTAEVANLVPMEARAKQVYIPMANPLYQLARQLGVLQRDVYLSMDGPYSGVPAPGSASPKDLCIQTEVAVINLGAVQVACIPGEIYPELVLDKVQTPVDPGADFPGAPVEPAVYNQLSAKYKMLIGLANDEIGYILPKRQWDKKPPFCYGRKKMQYGEVNSVGPEAGPIICNAIRDIVHGK